jgi:hypothetical protein
MPRGISRFDEAMLQGRLWTPDLVRPNLSFWQDAADRSTITIATGVSEWRDKSGNNRHFTQATGANQPSYSDTGFLGRPGITFDGTDDNLRLTGISSQITNQTHGVYWVFRRISGNAGGAGYNPTISVRTSNNSDGGALHYVKNSNALGASYPYYNHPATQSYDLTSGTAYQNGIGYVMSFQANAASSATAWSVHRSGTLEGNTNGITTPNSNNDGYVLAHQINPARFLNCVFGEVLMVQNTNARLRQLVEGYLAWKWGVLLGGAHPYANRPPLIGD